ncbi:response regulator transcription factor [Sporosarcina sp. Te-1]|uniref:response regulator transcription factor n=1 Tax=Sporosarcina sp. Te-1 TaxID=2818390 RepID=UPI001A9FC550|nr:response regulator transcription factor [Sporosarcina sp. Te-1]QTD39495.1 response regulator transcription factor [Sporosarcina sp. Te-1]
MAEQLLLVEDDAEIARIIRDTLQQEGYTVTWATTGLEGWEDFQSAAYDLVLVDWMLPEMDGITLCQNIRWKSDVPIIMISARKDDEDKVEGLDIGADDYLAKPFSLVELKARVASQLRRWRRYNGQAQESEESVFANGLTADWQREQVFLKGEEVPLTIKEFELLKLLAHNPDRVFSKNELYQHVWQQPEIGDSHTVTVHIKSLREKLKDPMKTPHFIQTVWGKGYRFIGETH